MATRVPALIQLSDPRVAAQLVATISVNEDVSKVLRDTDNYLVAWIYSTDAQSLAIYLWVFYIPSTN